MQFHLLSDVNEVITIISITSLIRHFSDDYSNTVLSTFREV